MECNLWEEKGFLFLSGELPDSELQAYKQHCETCDFCQHELQQYKNEKETLFTPEMFEDEPSPEIDREIIRVCTRPIKPVVHAPLFPVFVKNAIFALLILAVGFGGGAYFAGLKVSSDMKIAEQKRMENEKAVNNTRTPAPTTDVATTDSAAPDSTQIFKRGNLNMQGVVPVDLTDE